MDWVRVVHKIHNTKGSLTTHKPTNFWSLSKMWALAHKDQDIDLLDLTIGLGMCDCGPVYLDIDVIA